MPEVWGNPPSPRAALFWNGTAWQWALVDAAGRLSVRGEDQLHSYEVPLVSSTEAIISGADGHIDSVTPADGKVWHITNITARDSANPTTEHFYFQRRAAAEARFYRQQQAFAVNEYSVWGGHLWIEHDDVIRVAFIGGLVGDTCYIELTGLQFTKE